MRDSQISVGGIRELDLATCGSISVVDGAGVVRGLKTSAAFFTFLRANLALTPSSTLSSDPSTPLLEPWRHHDPAPVCSTSSPSPSFLKPLDDIPQLCLEPLQSHDDRVAGAHLVADSIAQMQRRAARALVFHPACLAVLAAAWAAAHRSLCHRWWSSSPSTTDSSAPLLCCCCCCVALALYLAAIQRSSSGYAHLAETARRPWLREGDIVLGARSAAGVLVGALVLRLEPRLYSPSSSASAARRRGRSGSSSLRGGKGVISAWTTRADHRGRGVGRSLLDAAVRLTKDRCGRDAEVGFAREHANSAMLLPHLFNGGFRRDEVRAARALERSLEGWGLSKRRRK